VVLSAVALAAGWALHRLDGAQYPFLIFLPVVLLAAFYARWKIASCMAVIFGSAGEYIFATAQHRHAFDMPHAAALAAFYVSCGLMIVAAEIIERSRVRTRDALAAAEANERRAAGVQRDMALVLDNVPAGVIYCDREHRLRFANRYYAARFGKTPDEIVGRTLGEVAGKDAYASVRQEIEQALQGNAQLFEREMHFEHIGVRIMQLSFAPDRGEDGSVRGFVALVTDVTEQKRAEAALRAADARLRAQAAELERLVATRTAKLTETVTELESFAYTVAHDLRAPLRAITSMTSLLDSEFGAHSSEDARDYMGRIRRAAARMDALIRDLLILSRVGRAEVVPGPIHLDNLIHTLLSENPDLQPPKAAVSVRGTLGTVLGNEMLLTQAISNLLGNAVKFVPVGTQPRVIISSEALDGKVRLWVEDNGVGIEPKFHTKIFGIFERLNPQYEGTGVGLAIVRRAVERMGGGVGLESQPGAGSRFWMELPAAPQGHQPAAQQEPRKILVA